MHTLVIDDDFISLFLTEKLLRQEGFTEKISTFHSSPEALTYFEQLLPDHLPEVVLLDLNMPVLSGWGFLQALRPYEAQLLGQCRVYILTSSLAPCDTVRAKEFAYVAGFIHKPLDDMEIQAIRAQVVGKNQ